jgi:hypothetical protein
MNSGCGSNLAFGFELTTAQRSLVLAQTRRIVNKALARHAIEDLSKGDRLSRHFGRLSASH